MVKYPTAPPPKPDFLLCWYANVVTVQLVYCDFGFGVQYTFQSESHKTRWSTDKNRNIQISEMFYLWEVSIQK